MSSFTFNGKPIGYFIEVMRQHRELMKAEDRVIAAQQVGIDAQARIATLERERDKMLDDDKRAALHVATLERELAAARDHIAMQTDAQAMHDGMYELRGQELASLRAAIDAAVKELVALEEYLHGHPRTASRALAILRAAQKAGT